MFSLYNNEFNHALNRFNVHLFKYMIIHFISIFRNFIYYIFIKRFHTQIARKLGVFVGTYPFYLVNEVRIMFLFFCDFQAFFSVKHGRPATLGRPMTLSTIVTLPCHLLKCVGHKRMTEAVFTL